MTNHSGHGSRHHVAAAAILLLAALLRLPGLGSFPPPMTQDEASRGYDAWCLWETGAERWGARWPFFLRSFGPGDYTAALSTYLVVPFVGLLGPGVVTTRLPNALCGVLTVLGVWLWLRRQFDERTALLAALLLAICPWHISMCRTAHESALGPFFLTWAFAAMCFARLPPFDRRWGDAPARASGAAQGPVHLGRVGMICWSAVAGLMFAMCAWVYPAPRMLVPIMLLVMAAANAADLCRLMTTQRGGRTRLAALIAGLALGGTPLWWTWLRAPEQLAARARAVSIFFEPSPWTQRAMRFAGNYFSEFDPRALFISDDDVAMLSQFQERTPFGRLQPVEAPLVLVGLAVVLAAARRRPAERWLLLWLLLHPLPAAVCGDWNPCALRAQLGIPVWSIISALGAARLLDVLRGAGAARRRIAVGAGAAALAVSSVHFGFNYFVRYPVLSADCFQENLVPAMQYARRHEAEYDLIWVTEISNQPYIYTLLFGPVPPREFAGLRRVSVPWYQRFEHVLRMGKYVYAPFVQPNAPIGSVALEAFRRELATFALGSRVLIIDVPGRGPDGEVLEVLPRRNGQPGIELRRGVLQAPRSDAATEPAEQSPRQQRAE